VFCGDNRVDCFKLAGNTLPIQNGHRSVTSGKIQGSETQRLEPAQEEIVG
jgi:hypothetical protein